ncbi:MAG TPA: TIGR03557 family F420-dependent LLM class oxidoreductase [Rhodopila sp.]|nr:TIGR03557 family F420-dependent LLM class oxidoreductase [Rhodopila sp.]
MSQNVIAADRRSLLKWTSMVAGATGLGLAPASGGHAATSTPPSTESARQPEAGGLRKGMLSYMLAHEQFPVPDLVRCGAMASRAGFDVLSTSDHLQPWQENQGHAGQAWVTMGALGAQSHSWMGTTVTCPTFRYNPAVVAEGFASLSLLYPGRIFLGVGSGEALNEEAATGIWPKWQERWDRLIEAITVIRQLWSGQDVSFKGKYYTVNARLYNPPPQPIPLLTAANGKKSMRLAGIHGDGLISDPVSWKKWKSHWEDGAREAGKNPADMPVLIEQYVVVGTESDAQQPAEFWRFGPKAWHNLFDDPSPASIQQKANASTPISEVLKSWVVSEDPAVHVRKVQELRESGVTIVNIHAPQADQSKVIEFYGRHVLPKLRQHA